MVRERGPAGRTGTLGNGEARRGTGVLGDRREDYGGNGEPGAVGTQRKMRAGNGELGRMRGLGTRGDSALTGAWAGETEIWAIPLLPWEVWVGEEPPVPPLPHSSSAAVSCLSLLETFLQLLLRGAKARAGGGVLAGVAELGWGPTAGSGGAGALAFVCHSPSEPPTLWGVSRAAACRAGGAQVLPCPPCPSVSP